MTVEIANDLQGLLTALLRVLALSSCVRLNSQSDLVDEQNEKCAVIA